MKWAALIAWVLTAGGGFVLLTIWLARGGMRQGREGGSRIRPPLILSHFLLAATGLVIWIIYLAADKDALKWIAFVILAVVALLGWPKFYSPTPIAVRKTSTTVVTASTPWSATIETGKCCSAGVSGLTASRTAPRD